MNGAPKTAAKKILGGVHGQRGDGQERETAGSSLRSE
jgi:hypothetical protein